MPRVIVEFIPCQWSAESPLVARLPEGGRVVGIVDGGIVIERPETARGHDAAVAREVGPLGLDVLERLKRRPPTR